MIPERLQKIFEELFAVDFPITACTLRSEIDRWDSIGHLNLIVELEDAFDIFFTKKEIEELDTVSKILRKLQE